MKYNLRFVLLLAFLGAWTVSAQEKKAIGPDDFLRWNSISASRISDDGNWASYVVGPERGDAILFIRNLKTGETHTVERGEQPAFLPDSRTLVFRIVPPFEMVRKMKLDKKKPDQMPKDSLGIYALEKGTLEKIPRVKSYTVPRETSSWFAYQLEKQLPAEDSLKVKEEMTEEQKAAVKKEKEQIKKANEKLKKAKGTDLVILDPRSGKQFVFNDITNCEVSRGGDLFSFVEVKNDSVTISRVLGFEPATAKLTGFFEAEGEVKRLTTDRAGKQLAFLFSGDTTKTKVYDLYYTDLKTAEAVPVVDMNNEGMPEGWCVSENGSLSFSENGSRLFFGTAPKPEPEPEDSLLPEEKYKMDLWSWTDGMIQPMQLARLNMLKNMNYQAVYHIPKKRMVQLADENMRGVRLSMKGDGDIALGYDDTPYLKYMSWDAGGYSDLYKVDVITGKREKIMTMTRNRTILSPGGKYLAYFESQDSTWYAYNMEKGGTVNLTGSLDARFYDPYQDTPSPMSSNGLAGWTENDRFILLYDFTDIWKCDPTGKIPPVNLTAAYGARNGIQYRYIELDREQDYIPARGEILLSQFNLKTKRAGYAAAYVDQPSKPTELLAGDYMYLAQQKAGEADRLLFRRSSFREFPDIWVSDMKFKNPQKISDANPQQEEYRWGTAELVEWTSPTGETLQGIFYKPENFDPEKKYPMMVYFYERYSDALHRYIAPRPSHNINFTQYLSNGYLVFLPDITYTIGYPGESAYNAVVSGTTHLINTFPYVDRDHIGIQGHSWGAYQVCYIITKTNLFKAAEAGAPVSNMTSAYDGIRWESGMVRQFQYEETQSRIGGTLWEKPGNYIENSPLFFVPRIETPLLILHNDDDGAVPWYQGIEMYAAMRRLDKPVWLLNYNGEPHHLTTWGNRLDYTIRMKQFFDHYLKGAPAPEWMVKGIPATEKGISTGYKLME